MIRALLDGRKTQTRRAVVTESGAPTEWHKLFMDFNFRPIEGWPDYLAGRDGFIYSTKKGSRQRLSGTPTSKGYLWGVEAREKDFAESC